MPPAMPPPPPMGAAPAGQWGPKGKQRGIGVSILLAVVTLGIYTFVWVWKTQNEIKRHAGIGVGGPLGFLIYFLISPVTFFLIAHDVEQMLARSGRPSRVHTVTGFWFLLPLIGDIVWFVKVQGQLNEYWASF